MHTRSYCIEAACEGSSGLTLRASIFWAILFVTVARCLLVLVLSVAMT